MACARPIVDFAVRVRPDDVCLVPEKRKELTTEGGLDVMGQGSKVRDVVSRLKKAGIRVSIFIDPDLKQVGAAKEAGADVVELHTGAYAGAKSPAARERELGKLAQAAACARNLGLILNAGHGLDYENTVPVAKIFGMHELNIGFSIVGRALFTGFETAVRDMKKLITG
jgi:pyridoxine 5-phosphate synthase